MINDYIAKILERIKLKVDYILNRFASKESRSIEKSTDEWLRELKALNDGEASSAELIRNKVAAPETHRTIEPKGDSQNKTGDAPQDGGGS